MRLSGAAIWSSVDDQLEITPRASSDSSGYIFATQNRVSAAHIPFQATPRRNLGLDQAAGFLRDDPVGVAALWDTVSQLADEPRLPESFPYGSPDLRRLRAGRYRVFYTIEEELRVVQIDHVARLP